MCIEYNECYYGGMYNVYFKLICKKNFVIIEIVHMNAGVSSEKEKVKESQSRRVTPPLDTTSSVGRHNSISIGYGNHHTTIYRLGLYLVPLSEWY